MENLINERDYCIKNSFENPRDERRIPVICNLIKELWINYRKNTYSIGFYYITNLLEIEGKKDEENGAPDPFYWEEDRWYDKLQDMIIHSKKFQNKNELSIEDIDDINKTIQYFENYWKLYSDFRLIQIIEIFDEVVEEKLRDSNFTNSDFWKTLLGEEQIKILNNSISHLKEQKESVENGTSDIFKGEGNIGTEKLKKIYLSQLENLIKKSQKKLEELKKEYGI